MQEKMQQLWTALAAAKRPRIEELFADDSNRAETFSAGFDDLLLDFSKTSISRDALALLHELAQTAGVDECRNAMFAGDKINNSEHRAVLHTALRGGLQGGDAKLEVDGENINAAVSDGRARFLDYAEQCRSGGVNAADGKPYADVVNIGIGGSDLGPAMAVAALAPFHDGPRIHFVSNMDGAHLADTLARLDPARTLIIISSKTFTTIETMTNASAARRWLTDALGEDAANTQLVAITAAADKAQAFGARQVFAYWDWVGGRYSMWGAVGLPIALAIGRQHFEQLLAGAAAMDTHFCSAPADNNLPLLLALVGVWHRNSCNHPTRALLPYDQRLHLLPAYLQQLEMESNGKRVMKNNAVADTATVPVVWGSAGTNAQHAYFQMLHQGTDIVPAEFIVAARPINADEEQHKLLLSNCLAQSTALMRGDMSADTPHRHFPGNRPSITIMHRELSPYALGRLIALYEHRTFVEGILWGINSFDQWGVELGKAMAKKLRPLLDNDTTPAPDASTQRLISHARGV